MKFITLVLTLIVIVSCFGSTSQLTDSDITTISSIIEDSENNDDDESTSTSNQQITKSDTIKQSEPTESTVTKLTINHDSDSNHDDFEDIVSVTQPESGSTEKTINVYKFESETINTNETNTDETSDESEDEDDNYQYHVNHVNQTLDLLNRWAKITENAIQMVVSEAMPHATEFGYRFNINENCILSLLQLVNGFRKQKAWAFKCEC